MNSDSAVLPPPDPANQHYLTQSLRTQDPRDALIQITNRTQPDEPDQTVDLQTSYLKIASDDSQLVSDLK